jgi:stage II sporulation SpoAA-like protein
MIRIIEGMPAGTIGVEAVGKVTEDDYRDVLAPALQGALERGDVRLMYVLGKDFDSYAFSGMWADTKLWAGHLRSWNRVAIVTDAEWIDNAVKVFGWLMPGRVKVFETDDADDAKKWLAEEDDD